MIVACVKTGSKYGPEYVNKLASMVRRHTTIPYDFICLTDDKAGLTVKTLPIPSWPPGWWAKLYIFGHPVLFNERVLFIDLDTVIVDNIDALLNYRGDFCIIQDWWANCYNSSVMSKGPGYGHHIVSRWNENIMNQMHGDQDWITKQVGEVDTWNWVAPGLIGSYKADDLAEDPRKFSLVCFHGDPKPHVFTEGWVRDNWI